MKRSVWNWLFLLSSFGLGGLFLFSVWQETFPEWKGYQAEYYQRLARVTGDPSKAEAPLKIQQIYLPEFHRTDRCITCHAGVDNPKMKDQPQPFRTHPDLGNPEFLAKHPFNEMGCTVCHQGQGPATTKRHAHGPVAHWEEPLLAKELTVGTCTTCHQNIPNLKGAERLVQAQALFQQKGCIGCHTLHGKGMLVGPELAETWRKGVDQFDFRYVRGEETTDRWVKEHFKDPQAVVPGYPALGIPESAMPRYELNDEEVQLLTALVLSFASEEKEDGRPIPARFKVAAAAPAPGPVYASKLEHGKAVFQKFGCAACHGVEGRGGIRNKNMEMAEEVPPLIYIAKGFTREELKETIRKGRYPARSDPNGPAPPLWMPAWGGKISEEELDALAEYLLSLDPDQPTPAASLTQTRKE
ncbi:MAG: c-type cytochrome [Candidatus Omnitrophica bacterium]|nr:c-type cytochrome [Candidatus Omnitrophota bacterium]